MVRVAAALSVSRFAELIGVPRRTCAYRLAAHRAGDPVKGPWPAPVVDRIEPVVAKHLQEWPAWGHRKIAAIARIDGHDIGSVSSLKRAMARRDLGQRVRCQPERRQLAKARRAVFVEPVERRNRVWQMDFSEFETAAGGTWRLGGVVDYFSKLALACPLTATGAAADLTAALDAAAERAEALLGHALSDDCCEGRTGDPVPLTAVTDNGSPMRSTTVARWFAARPNFAHVRTRHRSPHTNGVVERAGSSPSNTSASTATTSTTASISPPTSPATSTNTTVSGPTSTSTGADPSKPTSNRQPSNPTSPKPSNKLDTGHAPSKTAAWNLSWLNRRLLAGSPSHRPV